MIDYHRLSVGDWLMFLSYEKWSAIPRVARWIKDGHWMGERVLRLAGKVTTVNYIEMKWDINKKAQAQALIYTDICPGTSFNCIHFEKILTKKEIVPYVMSQEAQEA